MTEVEVDFKGREKKVYGQYTTPYEKLKEVSRINNQNYLKPNLTFEQLDKIAYTIFDNDFVKKVRKHQDKLFDLNNLLKSR